MLPRPTTPRILSRSSKPRKRERSQRPALTAWSAWGMWRARASIIAIVCSVAAIVLPEGALTTRTPARVAASTSMLSTPAPARPITLRRVPAWITLASTLVSLRTMSASYSEIAPGLEHRLRLLAGQRLREVHRRYGWGRDVGRTREQPQSERARGGAEGRGHPKVPLKDGRETFLAHHQ